MDDKAKDNLLLAFADTLGIWRERNQALVLEAKRLQGVVKRSKLN